MGSHIVIAPGSINVDLILRTDVLKGPKTFRGCYSESQGGKGSNQAIAARRAGEGRHVYLVGAVGKDPWGEQALAALRDAGVDTCYVRRDATATTGVVMEYLYADGEVTIGLEPGANDRVGVDDIERARSWIESAALLLAQIENPLDTVEHTFRMARAAGVATCLDPSVVPVVDTERRRLFDDVLPHVDLLAPNRSEAEELADIPVDDDDSAVAAAKWLLDHVPVVVLTRGAEGALVARGDEIRFVRGLSVDSIDGGAAGDTFRGALGLALAEARDAHALPLTDLPFDVLVDAARFANAAAAICVTRPGACESIPTREEITARLASGSPRGSCS
ncbi:MAG: ribokinase [Candidatus Latescibacterota bacterium]|jgi:ribokinase|nr:ribokinase [Candidatus Latescibacterota bacterium]